MAFDFSKVVLPPATCIGDLEFKFNKNGELRVGGKWFTKKEAEELRDFLCFALGPGKP